MFKVVSNTTPILSLLKIDQLHLLELLFHEVIVPFAVWQEIEQGRGGVNYTDLRKIPFIKIEKVNNNLEVEQLTSLDKGEAEVIILAKEICADLVIIDESAGRFFAKRNGLMLTGTLGILINAKKEGYIQAIRPLMELLKRKGTWIGDSIFEEILLIAGENK